MATPEDSDRTIISRTADGAIPGVCFGFALGAARAYLESRAVAEKAAAATAAALAQKPPPSAAALRALQPKPLPALFATTAIYGALGGVFTGVEALSENMRGKQDMWNGVIGAGATGSLVGLRSGSIGMSAGASFACAAMVFSLGMLGGKWGPNAEVTEERRLASYKS